MLAVDTAKYDSDQPRDALGRWTLAEPEYPAYHGTPIANLPGIQRDGLESNQRERNDWEEGDRGPREQHLLYFTDRLIEDPGQRWGGKDNVQLRFDRYSAGYGVGYEQDALRPGEFYLFGNRQPFAIAPEAIQYLTPAGTWRPVSEWAPDAQKYDPSQPRDDRGRWTDAGESHALSGTTGVAHNWDPSLITVPGHWTDIAAARADLAARHENTRFSPTLDRCDPAKVLPALAAYDVLATTFPGVAVQSVGSTWLKGEAAGAIAMTEVNTRDPRGSKIVLNEKVFGSDPFEGWGDKHGWTVAGTDNPQGTMFHEFGHAVIAQVAANSRGAPITDTMRRFSTDEAVRSFTDRASLSSYAAIGGGHEAAAEGFAAAYNPDSQASTHPIAVSVRTLVEDTGVGEPKDDVAFWDRYWGATQVAAQKFDPSQPRDEAGRWTAIPGGSEVAASAQRHLEALRGLSTARINAYVMDKTNTGVEVDRIDRERWREMAAQFVALHEAFPQVLISSIVMENSRKAWQPPGTIAWCTTDPWYNNADIHLSREIWHQTPRYSIPTDDNGWHVPGTSTPAAYMAHEFGHAVDNVATQATSRETVYPDTPLGWRGSGMYQHEQQVGGYAGAGGAKEVFAEIFGAVYSGHADALPAGAADGLHGYLTAAIGPHPVTKAAASPLVFMDAARRVLARGYADAYLAGHADTFTDEEDGSRLDDYDEPDPDFVDEQVADVSDGAANRLVRLASLLVGGIVSARMLDSWLGGYAASAGGVYQQGFQNGVAAQGEIARAQWRTEEDGIVCQPCDDRDGQVWFGEEHPYPGDGYYGEQCAGGPNCRCVLVYTIVPMSGADDDTVPPLLTDLAPFEDFSWEDLRKFSESQPRDERGRWAAAEAVRMAPSVRRGLEPDFQSESRHYPPTGPANGFTTHTRQYAAHQRLPAFTSTDIGAYDPAGTLVGTFSLAHGGAQDGYFKISVRPDAQRQGYGTRLLAEAERQGIDLTAVAGKNNYTPSGRALLVSYLGRDTVRKYSDSQPRDEHGRWVNGDKAWRVRAALGQWMFSPSGTRAIRLVLSMGDLAIDEVTGLHAKVLVDAVAEGGPAPRLYRGISFASEMPAYRQLRASRSGDTLDLNVSSWTSDPDHANFHAGRQGNDYRVHFTLEPGATALQAGQFASDNREHEYLTDGRFTVTGVESYESPRPAAKDWLNATISQPEGVNEHVNITLRQDAVFTQAEQALGLKLLKYSPDEPRDERGQWTDSDADRQAYARAAARLGPEATAAIDRWAQGYSRQMRQSLAHPGVSALSTSLRGGAVAMLDAANAAPPTTYPLYRGIGFTLRNVGDRLYLNASDASGSSVGRLANPVTSLDDKGNDAKYRAFLADMQPGTEVALNLSSWTRDQDAARQFAANEFANVTTDARFIVQNQVVIAVEPGAHAVDIGEATPQGGEFSEHVMAGRFEVVGLEHQAFPATTVVNVVTGERAEVKGATVDVVTLRQVATLEPDELVGTKVLKYDENQPRDLQGRWIAAGGPNPDPELHYLIAKWSDGYYDQYRTALATRGDWRYAIRVPGAVRLLEAANTAPPTRYPLYRGIGFNLQDHEGNPVDDPAPWEAFRAAVTPGAVLPMNLSSWTRDPSVARQFASNSFNTVGDNSMASTQVTFKVEPGARALDATYDIEQGPQYSEHLMAGLFEVTGVEEKVLRLTSTTLVTVGLRQVGLLDPESIVGAKVQKRDVSDEPRDDHGRWTAGGGTYSDIAAAHMPDLTHDDLWNGVLTYQWSSDRVNSWLRGLDFPIAADRRLKKAMDAVMAKTVPLKHDLVVYRGEAGKDFVGDTARQVSRAATFDGTKGFTDKAYMSTTQDRDKAMFYAKADARDRGGRPFVVELHLPAGSRALPLDDAADLAGGGYWPGSGDSMYGPTRIFHVDSQEWVLPRGSSWEPKGMNGKMPVYELRP